VQKLCTTLSRRKLSAVACHVGDWAKRSCTCPPPLRLPSPACACSEVGVEAEPPSVSASPRDLRVNTSWGESPTVLSPSPLEKRGAPGAWDCSSSDEEDDDAVIPRAAMPRRTVLRAGDGEGSIAFRVESCEGERVPRPGTDLPAVVLPVCFANL